MPKLSVFPELRLFLSQNQSMERLHQAYCYHNACSVNSCFVKSSLSSRYRTSLLWNLASSFDPNLIRKLDSVCLSCFGRYYGLKALKCGNSPTKLNNEKEGLFEHSIFLRDNLWELPAL